MTNRALGRNDNLQGVLRYAAGATWNDLTVSATDGRQRIIELTLWGAAETSAQRGAPTLVAAAGCAGKPTAAQLSTGATLGADDRRQLVLLDSAEATGAPRDSEVLLAQAVALAPPQTTLLQLNAFIGSDVSIAEETDPTAPSDRAVDTHQTR